MKKILTPIGVMLAVTTILTIHCDHKKKVGEVIISDKVKLPEKNQNFLGVIIKGDTLNLIYQSGASKPEFRKGDILVGEIGYGYLKRVLSTTARGDTLVVLTEQACLTDAIERGKIDTTFSLSPHGQQFAPVRIDSFFIKDGKKYRYHIRSAQPQLSPQGELFNIKIPDISIEIRDPQNNPAVSMSIDTIILTKGFDVDLELQIDGGIKYFKLVGISSDGIHFNGVNTNLIKSVSDGVEIPLLPPISLGEVIIFIGFVPIVFDFQLLVYGGLDADLALTMRQDITSELNLTSTNTIGTEFSNGSWHPICDNTLTCDVNWSFSAGPSGPLSATLKKFLKGCVACKIYGVIGPGLYLKPYLYDEISYPPFDFDVGGGIAAGLEFKVKILSWELADFDYTFADYSRSFFHSTNAPPNTPATPSGAMCGDTCNSYEFSSSTADLEGENIAIRFDWGDGNISNWSSYVPSGETVSMSHRWAALNTYYVKAQAKDINGTISGWSARHEIVITEKYPDTVVATIPVGDEPAGIAALPNGEYVYVANRGSDNVSVIQTSDNTVVATIPLGDEPAGIAALPNGEYVYVACRGLDCDVLVIRTSDNTVAATVPLTVVPHSIAPLPNGEYVYVTCEPSQVLVIRTSDNTVVATIPVGNEPAGIAALPNGEYVYVTNQGSDNVSVIRTTDNTVVATIPVGNEPAGIAALPNGRYVYVANYWTDSTVSVIRTSDNTVVATIPVAGYPWSIAALPTGNYVYVTHRWYSGIVSVIRTFDNTVVKRIVVDHYPRGIAVHPDGRYVYFTLSWANSVWVLGLR
ncbi:MAG: YncE family protein [candidate division WOR-3 bacterium]